MANANTFIAGLLLRQDVQTLLLMGIRGTSLVFKFLLTLFIARFMGFEDLGLYGLIVSATIVVPIFSGLGIMYVRSRYSVTQSPDEDVSMIRHYGRFIAYLYAFLFLIGLAVGFYTNNLWLVMGVMSVVLFEHLNNDFYSLLLNKTKALSANILHFIRSSLWIFTFMVLAYLYPSLQSIEVILMAWAVGGLAAFFGFFYVTRDWPWKIKQPLMPIKQWVSSEFKESRTIYLNNMMDSSSQYMNHFLVTIFLGLELTGVYVFYMQIVNALSNLMRTGVIMTTRPKLVTAAKVADGSFEGIYKRCRKHTFLISFALAIISLPIMYFITVYLVDKPLALQWFSVFFANLVFFMLIMAVEADQLVLYSRHRDDIFLKLSLFNVIGLFVFNVVLINLFSLWGAVFALILMAILKLLIQRKIISKMLAG